MTLVKICGLMRDEDVGYVNRYRPDMAGFIMCPGFRRTRSVEEAKRMVGMLAEGIRSVGVFLDQSPEEVISIADEVGFDVIQLHGGEDDCYIEKVRNATGMMVVKAFTVRTQDDVVRAKRSSADLVMLDGGTGDGRPFDWSLIGSVGRDYILAGGLTPENVGDAVARLRPFAVDASSGVETEHFKDEQKISALIRAVRTADGDIS